jgi:hypothetical protein
MERILWISQYFGRIYFLSVVYLKEIRAVIHMQRFSFENMPIKDEEFLKVVNLVPGLHLCTYNSCS